MQPKRGHVDLDDVDQVTEDHDTASEDDMAQDEDGEERPDQQDGGEGEGEGEEVDEEEADDDHRGGVEDAAEEEDEDEDEDEEEEEEDDEAVVEGGEEEAVAGGGYLEEAGEDEEEEEEDDDGDETEDEPPRQQRPSSSTTSKAKRDTFGDYLRDLCGRFSCFTEAQFRRDKKRGIVSDTAVHGKTVFKSKKVLTEAAEKHQARSDAGLPPIPQKARKGPPPARGLRIGDSVPKSLPSLLLFEQSPQATPPQRNHRSPPSPRGPEATHLAKKARKALGYPVPDTKALGDPVPGRKALGDPVSGRKALGDPVPGPKALGDPVPGPKAKPPAPPAPVSAVSLLKRQAKTPVTQQDGVEDGVVVVTRAAWMEFTRAVIRAELALQDLRYRLAQH
jgi:hypothetical protein